MIDAGELRDVAWLAKVTRVQEPLTGEEFPALIPVADCIPCKLEGPLSGSASVQAYETQETGSYRLTLRWRPNVTQGTTAFVVRGRVLYVDAANDVGGRRVRLECACTAEQRQ